jgi:hypothetical protein
LNGVDATGTTPHGFTTPGKDNDTVGGLLSIWITRSQLSTIVGSTAGGAAVPSR